MQVHAHARQACAHRTRNLQIRLHDHSRAGALGLMCIHLGLGLFRVSGAKHLVSGAAGVFPPGGRQPPGKPEPGWVSWYALAYAFCLTCCPCFIFCLALSSLWGFLTSALLPMCFAFALSLLCHRLARWHALCAEVDVPFRPIMTYDVGMGQ